MASFFYNFFKKYEDWFILPEQTENSRTGWLAFPLIVKDNAPFSRQEMQIFFEKRNIQTRTIFTGNINRQPGSSNIKKRVVNEGYPVADYVMKGGILLACHHGLNKAMVDHIHSSFIELASK